MGVICGHNLRYQKRLHPTQRKICQLHQQSPLIQLIICHSHGLIGCGQGMQSYLDHVRLSWFNCVNLEPMVTKLKNDCKLCSLVHLILNNTNLARKLANYLQKGPDEFVPLSLSDQPLSVIQIDETGPIYLGKDGYFVKVWILLAVEIVTRLEYLVPLKSQGTVDLIKALDILQTRRGRLSRIG